MGVWKPIDTASSGATLDPEGPLAGQVLAWGVTGEATARRFGQYPSSREVGERFALVVRHISDFSSLPDTPLLRFAAAGLAAVAVRHVRVERDGLVEVRDRPRKILDLHLDAVVMAGDTSAAGKSVTFKAVPVGVLNIQVRRVMATADIPQMNSGTAWTIADGGVRAKP